MIKYNRENLTPKLQREIIPLLTEHWAEIAHFRDIPLEINWDQYYTLFHMKLMHIFTARNDGVLVGYNVFFAQPNIHYSSSLQAVEDILYLDPEHRGKMVGFKLIKFADKQLTKVGVEVIHRHLKAAHDYSPMLERIGYELTDKIYSKRAR